MKLYTRSYQTLIILVILLSTQTNAQENSVSQIMWSDNLTAGSSYRWTVKGLDENEIISVETGETVAEITTTDSNGNPTTTYETGTYTWTQTERVEYKITILTQLPVYDVLQVKDPNDYVRFTNKGIQELISFELLGLLMFPTRFVANSSEENNLISELADPNSLYAEELRKLLGVDSNDTIISNTSYFQINGESSRQYLPATGLLEYYTLENETHDIQIALRSDGVDDMAANFDLLMILFGNLVIIVVYRKRLSNRAG